MFTASRSPPRQTLRQYLKNVSLLQRGKSTGSLPRESLEDVSPLKCIESQVAQIMEVCGTISALNIEGLQNCIFLKNCVEELQKFHDRMRQFLNSEKSRLDRQKTCKSYRNLPSPRSPTLMKLKSKQYIESTSTFQKPKPSNQISDTQRFFNLQDSLAHRHNLPLTHTNLAASQTPFGNKECQDPNPETVPASSKVDHIFGSNVIPSYQLINLDGLTGAGKRRNRRMGEVYQPHF